MKYPDEDILLAKWLAGELNDKEKAIVEQLPHLKELRDNLELMNSLDIPNPDLAKIKRGLDEQRKESPFRRFQPWIWTSVAAAVLVGVLLWFFVMEQPIILKTAKIEHENYTLPDQSLVILNAASSIKYFKKNWNENQKRLLSLQGEAFFNVKKGSTFTVRTPQGKVQVVGTQFSVLSRDGIFEVVCYEGKVRVFNTTIDTLLLPGHGLESADAKIRYFESETESPTWIDRTLTFRQKKLSFVFSELERQFDIDVDYSGINARMKFSGGVPLDDKELALEIICKAMALKYEFLSDKKQVLIFD